MSDTKEEIWRDVFIFDRPYQVSNLGFVRFNDQKSNYGLKKPLKMKISSHGYIHFSVYNKGNVKSFQIHRIVAQAFIPNPENKPQVNHKDGNKKNNSVSNLEWATRSENQIHRFRVLKIKNRITSTENISIIRENKDSLSLKKLAKITGVCASSISLIKRGKTYKTQSNEPENT